MAGSGIRFRVTAAIAAAATVVTLGLGGCANSPSTAATVGGRTFTTSEVTRASQELAKINPRLAEPGLVLSVKMRGAAAEQIAASRGIDLTAETNKLLPQLQIPPQLLSQPAGQSFVMDVVKADALAQKLGQAEMGSALAFIPVHVNPRYGVKGLEDVANSEGGLGSGSLSRPAAQ